MTQKKSSLFKLDSILFGVPLFLFGIFLKEALLAPNETIASFPGLVNYDIRPINLIILFVFSYPLFLAFKAIKNNSDTQRMKAWYALSLTLGLFILLPIVRIVWALPWSAIPLKLVFSVLFFTVFMLQRIGTVLVYSIGRNFYFWFRDDIRKNYDVKRIPRFKRSLPNIKDPSVWGEEASIGFLPSFGFWFALEAPDLVNVGVLAFAMFGYIFLLIGDPRTLKERLGQWSFD